MAQRRRKFNYLVLLAAVAGLGSSLGLSAPAVAAEPYPAGPVTIILPFGPGSVTDMTTRLLAEHLQAAFGKPFLVNNKAGAGGTIGSAAGARAQPNGYTLLFATNTTHSVVKSLFKHVPYDPERDFVPVARVVGIQSMIVVSPNLPVNTIEEFVAHLKKNPGKLRYGYGNASGQIAGETLKRELGVDMVAVPYRSNPQAITEILGGHIEVGIIDLATGLPQVKADKLRPLAILTGKRTELMPEIPTMGETVAPRFDVMAWGGVFAPAGTPPEIVKALANEIKKFVARKDIREKLIDSGVEPFYAGPEDFVPFLKTEKTRWTQLAQAAGVQPE